MHMLENDERPGPQAGDAPDAPAVTSATEPKADAKTVESKTGDATAPAQDQTPGKEATAESKGKKVVPRIQERFDELTAQKKEWQRKAEELDAKLTAAQAPGKDATNEPTPEQFKTWDAYEKAQREWVFSEATRRAKVAILQEQSNEAKAKAKDEAEAHFGDARKRFDDRAIEIAPQYEGLDKAIENLFAGKIPNNSTMAEFLFEGTDNGPQLVFYLNAHIDEARAIAKLSPVAAAAAMARLEDKLTAETTPAKKSEAPPPPKQVRGGSASDGYDPEKATTDENIGRWRAKERRKA